jgi:AraC-like DNA-binding protein
MKSRNYRPSPLLSAYIHSFWTIQTSQEEEGRFRFASDGHPELFFNLKKQTSFSFCSNKEKYTCPFGVMGQFYNFSELDIANQECTFFVKFQPYGLYALFQHDISVFNNCISELPELKELHDKMNFIFQTTENIQLTINVVENWLLQKLKSYPHLNLVNDILHQLEMHYKTATHIILERYGLSNRRIQQIFKEKVGLSPKQYQRMLRFRKAMKQLPQTSQNDIFLSTLGYHDWSHFSKDMYYFFELSPGDFISRLHQDNLLINVRA